MNCPFVFAWQIRQANIFYDLSSRANTLLMLLIMEHRGFPSVRKNGSQPMMLDMVLKKTIRPALRRAGTSSKVIGWHSFRHSLATNLRSLGG